jgi:hypothetical protein
MRVESLRGTAKWKGSSIKKKIFSFSPIMWTILYLLNIAVEIDFAIPLISLFPHPVSLGREIG